MTKIIDRNKLYLAGKKRRIILIQLRKIMDELVSCSMKELEKHKKDDELVESVNKYLCHYKNNNIWLSS